LLVCPDEGNGADAVTLSEENQALTPEPDAQSPSGKYT
jgi:hypothetical protein